MIRSIEEEMHDRQALAIDRRDNGACEFCGTTDPSLNIQMRGSMTVYHYDGPAGDDADPNREWRGCEPCSMEYEEHWQAQWDEYHASRS